MTTRKQAEQQQPDLMAQADAAPPPQTTIVWQASSDPGALLRLAVEQGADVDRLERLMALQERWQAAQAQRAFIEGMAEFQSRMPAIPKVREVHRSGGGLLYKFANADDITSAIRANERDCGFSHRFEFQPRDDGGCRTTCIVTHKGGHSERTTVDIPPTKGMNTNAAQDCGIAMQYGMRYSLVGAYGITTGAEDTDGRGAPQETLTQAHLHQLQTLVEQTGADESKLCAWAGVPTLEAFPEARFEEAVRLLKRKVKGGAA